jgi:hypothetical protein
MKLAWRDVLADTFATRCLQDRHAYEPPQAREREEASLGATPGP